MLDLGVDRVCRNARGVAIGPALTVGWLRPSAPAIAASDWQAWPSVAVRHPLDDRLNVGLESQLRFDEAISQLNVALIRLDLVAKLSRYIFAALGYDHFIKVSARANSENRVWQQVRHEFPAGAFSLENRFRIEERFIEDVGGVAIRGRYRLRLDCPVADPAWRLVASNEVLVNLASEEGGPPRGFHQNRLFGGFSVRFSERIAVESGLQWLWKDGENEYVLMLGFTIDTLGQGLP